jgi:hypothetical protein
MGGDEQAFLVAKGGDVAEIVAFRARREAGIYDDDMRAGRGDLDARKKEQPFRRGVADQGRAV